MTFKLMILLLPRDATRVIPEIAIIDPRASSLAPTEAAEKGGLKTLRSERAWREQPPCGHPLLTRSGPSLLTEGMMVQAGPLVTSILGTLP